MMFGSLLNYLRDSKRLVVNGYLRPSMTERCIYLKVSGSNFIFLVLYVDDILLASNDLGLLKDTKSFLSENFEMKDMGLTSFVIGIEMYRDRSRRLLGLSQKAYINNVAAKKVMRYLQGTKDYILTYRAIDQLEMIECSDSDYACCLDNRKSTSGYVFLLAELRVVDTIMKLLRMYYDSVAIVYYSKNDKHSSRAKHIGVKYNFVKEAVQKQEVSIVHIKTSLMIAC
ncbi:uncharacterized protein LOC122069943 [Macadamia integrifolia]|uniref:uncharacterized protein LOC122069943 n=1 Tax=Macadamia integrifolia TaxID=60698 RepID=UPI001C4EBCC2|nr:uncharacterized protein LOC122069943 [Macadamia integrifolia]